MTDNYSSDLNSDSEVNFDNRKVLLRFIDTYRKQPELWDVSLKDYLNKDKRNVAYDKLLKIYKIIKRNATRDDVRKKINSLRTNFRKELKKVEASKRSGIHADDVYEPKCWTFKELSFLAGTSSNHVGRQMNEVEVSTFYSSLNLENNSNSMKRKNESINISNEQHLKKSVNEEDIIAKTWAFKLARMKPDQRIWAEKFINDILTEGELGTLHRHSVGINQQIYQPQFVDVEIKQQH